MRIVGSRLRVAISRAGFKSNVKFAAACGLSRYIISNLCNDKYQYEPQPYTIQRICETAGVTPEYLSGREGFDQIPDQYITREEKARRILFDLFVTLGRIESLADGSGLYRLHGDSGYSDFKSIDITEKEMQNLLMFFQKKIDMMCDEYMELCTIHNRDEFLKKWYSAETVDLFKRAYGKNDNSDH